MNDQRFPRKISLLESMRERVCDDGAALAVLQFFLWSTAATLLGVGCREQLVGLVLAAVLCAVVGLLVEIIAPDAIGSLPQRIGTLDGGEIERLTDDEFDALVEQIEREARPSVPAPVPLLPPAGRHDAAHVRGVTTRPGWRLRLRRAPTLPTAPGRIVRVAR